MDLGNLESDIKKALSTAFIDSKKESTSSITPKFLYNDRLSHRKIIDSLRSELKKATSFAFSVAFITQTGYQLLKETLKELQVKGIKGRILTTDYLSFTDPDVLAEIKAFFPNIEIRIYKTLGSESEGFHTKGYIFEQKQQGKDVYKLIIGSSNLTASALSENKEWNAELVSTASGKIIGEVLDQFESLWKEATPLDSYIDTYRQIYEAQKQIAISKPLFTFHDYQLKPNQMQTRFVSNLKHSYEIGRDGTGDKRGLLISATGTGKTYASAFGIRELKPKRVLFLAHRTQLLSQAIMAYQSVFPSTSKFALLSGDASLRKTLDNVSPFEFDKQESYDFVFSTSELMGKKEILTKIDPKQFDFIVIDEVHRAGSPTYLRLLKYFMQRYVLGMSATPERSDDPSTIYSLFDNNVIYEIRLQDALEENLLCPFHYYGVTDVEWSDDKLYEKKEFSRLFNDERVDYILKQTRFYGYSGKRLKGLIFVSGKEDGRILEAKLLEKGLKVTFLSGEDEAKIREEKIRMLEKDDVSTGDYLDYIITIDIFNEGIDIPSINQVVFLRPTASSIIFIQQLGRGLRKSKDKDFVVIIDFIGNYENNFMIAKAFSFGGDKEIGRIRLVNGGDLPGISTIEFDEIARSKILRSLSNVSFNTLKEFSDTFFRLANKLYRMPTYEDYENFSDFDPLRIINKYGSYYSFLKKVENKFPHFIKAVPFLSGEEERILIEAGRSLGAGIRIEEPLLLLSLIKGGDYQIFLDKLRKKGLPQISKEKEECLRKIFMGKWSMQNTFAFADESFTMTKSLQKCLQNPYFSSELESLLRFYIHRFETNYTKKYRGTDLCLNAQYSYKDVCELLNYEKDLTSVLGGYRYHKRSKTFPIFINYNKSPSLDESTKYEDIFINQRVLAWESKRDRTPDSEELAPLYQSDTKIYLFVRKNNTDKDQQSKKFYFLGGMKLIGELKPKPKDTGQNGKNINYAAGTFELFDDVRNDIYEYLQANLKE